MSTSALEEVKTIKKMLDSWMKSYASIGTQDCYEDFRFEIEEIVMPYIMRLYECGYIDKDQVEDFISYYENLLSKLKDVVTRKNAN